MGSGKIISDAERTALNNISGVNTDVSDYTLPTASGDVLGGIIVGNNLSIDTSGVLSIKSIASSQNLGLVKIDNSSNIILNNSFITTKLPLISNYIYDFNMTPLHEVIINKKTTTNPIWVMRQAGRYLPEFREIRKENSDFIKLCLNEKLSSEITLQPVSYTHLTLPTNREL